MITEKEEKFLIYWEKNREIENTFAKKLMSGLPMALIFSLPIILFIAVIRIFFPEWYMKISGVSPQMFISVLLAIICLVLFYSFFRMQYKWENNEQLYKEILNKQRKLQHEL